MQRKNKWTPISFSIKIMTKSKCQVSLAVKYSSQVSKFFSIDQGQPTLQSMFGQNSDVNKGRNSVANLQKHDTLQSKRRSCQR